MWRELTVLRLHLGRCEVELRNADTCRSPAPACLPLFSSAQRASSCRCFVPPKQLPIGRRLLESRYAKTTCRDLRPDGVSRHAWLCVLHRAAGVRTSEESVVERPFLLSS